LRTNFVAICNFLVLMLHTVQAAKVTGLQRESKAPFAEISGCFCNFAALFRQAA
jgi:hypothetical protein